MNEISTLDNRFSNHLTALKLRTLIIGIVAITFGLMAGFSFPSALNAIVNLLSVNDGFPPLDIPRFFNLTTFMTAVFWLLFLGLFTRKVTLKYLPTYLVLWLFSAAMSFVSANYVTSPLGIFPSQLQQDIKSGQFARAMSEVSTVFSADKDDNDLVVNYLKAQIALRDPQARTLLESQGKALLNAVDARMYGSITDEVARYTIPKRMLSLNAHVLYAVDVAINGSPMSVVGIEFAQRHQPAMSFPKTSWWIRLGITALSVWFALLLASLWWSMWQRTQIIANAI